MSDKQDLKILKLKLKAQKEAAMLQEVGAFMRSPLVQIIGGVAVTELLEKADVLSGRWAGAIEGGIIAMIGLQALKDYGIYGASALGVGVLGGSVIAEPKDYSESLEQIKHPSEWFQLR